MAQVIELNQSITLEWRAKAANYIAENDLFDKPHLMRQIKQIYDEAAIAEFNIYMNTVQKLDAILELELLKEQANTAENKDSGVH